MIINYLMQKKNAKNSIEFIKKLAERSGYKEAIMSTVQKIIMNIAEGLRQDGIQQVATKMLQDGVDK